MTPPIELTAAQLRRRSDPARFGFASTADAPGLEGIIGQDRAARAIEFGLEIPYPGFNVFATGPTGAGKTSIITHYLEDRAALRPAPPDWGYAHNFEDPDRPIALRLPPGSGNRLREEVNALLETALYEVLPLCNTKGEEWCAEELIELGKRARNVNAPDSLNAHLLLRDLFVDMVRIRGLRPEARELAIADLSSGIADVQAICR